MSTPVPQHLSSHAATGISKGQPVAQFELGSLRNFVYLVIDWKEKAAWIVDPQSDVETLIKATDAHELKVAGILLTHGHHDHVAGVPALVKSYPGIQIIVGSRDAHRLKPGWMSRAKVTMIAEESEMQLGALKLRMIPTPGHSPGEICYFLHRSGDQPSRHPPFLLTGDTVFIRDCGRTDFADGSNEEMFASLQRIRKFPPDTVILPGHHYQAECASTLGRELAESPPFQCRSVTELASLP